MTKRRGLFVLALIATVPVLALREPTTASAAVARAGDPPPQCVACTSEQQCRPVGGVGHGTLYGWYSCDIFWLENEQWCNNEGDFECSVVLLSPAAEMAADGSLSTGGARGRPLTVGASFKLETGGTGRVVEYGSGGTASVDCKGHILDRQPSSETVSEVRSATRVIAL